MYQLKPLHKKEFPILADKKAGLANQSTNNFELQAGIVTDSVMRTSEGDSIRMKPLKADEENMLQPNLRMHPFNESAELFQSTPETGKTPFHKFTSTPPVIQMVPMPDPATVNSLEDNPAGSRQGVRYDTGFDWQSVLSRYFVQGIDMDVRAGYNVTYIVRGFPSGEEWVSNALKALTLYNFNLNGSATESAILNIASVQHLDLSNFTNPADTAIHGPNANFRFTSTEFDATGRGTARIQNVQLLIEKLSDFNATTTTETADQRRQRFATTYQITNAVPVRNDPLGDPPETMTDSQFDQVLEGLNRVPASLLARVTGIPVHRIDSARGPHNEVAEYKQTRAAGSTTWERRIVVYNDFFSMNADQKAFTMIHEIGHALDFRPNEASGGSGGPSASAATGTGSFRAAVTLDGGLSKGVSTYAATATDYDEYYAEAFAMYQSQPATLKALRPNVYVFFSTQFP